MATGPQTRLRHRVRAAARAGATAALGLTLAGALSGCGLVVMAPVGDVALQQRNLILIATGLMLLIIVPVLVLTVLFAWRYRQGGNAAYDPDFQHSTGLELVIWSCPLLIIIVLGAVTWTSTHLLDPFRPLSRITTGQPTKPGVEPLDVQAVAMDWKWLFIYPEQGIATINELALPVDRPVRFSITSVSQMNTFYAPTMAGMIYAMPGMRSTLHAVLNRPVESWGQSANYTGAGFSDMRFTLRGLPQGAFDRWVAGVKGAGVPLPTAAYLQLQTPSEKVAVMRFASVQPGLFDRVLNRCVEPGRPCAAPMIMRDRREADRPAGLDIPPARDAAPLPGGKPEPALEKSPAEKGAGGNRAAPRTPPPGQNKPGDDRNRTFS